MARSSSQSGSIVFYILLAVALFAALSFAVSRMMRGGGRSVSDEISQVQASEILQYARSLRGAVQAMQVDGVAATDFSFNNGIVGGYTNACASGGNECKIFNADGGGLSYAAPDADWLDSGSGVNHGEWVFSGDNAVTDIGTAAPELLAILPWVTRTLCVRINDMLGITNPGGEPPQDDTDVNLADKFTGTYTATQTIGGGDPQIEGQRAGCFRGDNDPADGTYHFFQVLIAR